MLSAGSGQAKGVGDNVLQAPSGEASETDLRERIQDSDGFQDGYFGFIQSLALAGTNEVFTLLGSSWATQRCPTLSYKHL